MNVPRSPLLPTTSALRVEPVPAAGRPAASRPRPFSGGSHLSWAG
ncbi:MULTISPECIES: hypothetical protein [Deinococcus]|uniref:Uncharacterized protein n=1 Tax=Deinococcus rufus TaxID=2136097 RepID=A0ABV7Z6C5_9DEIO|nr:hypothetical protein [Deinococcus sp. AB2017081]WQE96092.1 hypothetical protein U2P90_04150 [Deinococcus sp. AB2017081]